MSASLLGRLKQLDPEWLRDVQLVGLFWKTPHPERVVDSWLEEPKTREAFPDEPLI